MYVVIFRAKVKEVNDEYFKMLERMKELSLQTYKCLDLVTVVNGDDEMTISYWENAEDILKWKQNTEHLSAQELGQECYESYQVQIAEIKREYKHEAIQV